MGCSRVGLFVLTVTAVCSGRAFADDVTTPGDYVAIQPARLFPEKSLGTTGKGFGLGIAYGRPLTGRWGIEAQLGGAVLETGVDGGTDYYQQFLTVDLTFNFLAPRAERWTPFFLIGAGAAYDDRFPDDRDGTALLLEAGLGVVSGKFWGERLRLRAEARYVHDNREGGRGEPRAALGIEIPLGRVIRTVEQVPVEKVVERIVYRDVERPPADTDGDGVNDGGDQCPDTPRGLRVDGHGCVVVKQAIDLRGVTFDFNQARLTPNAQTVLDGVARAFAGQPSLRVEIAGHTDSVGSPEFNARLSQRRADAVRNYLLFKGATPAQLGARGYGESQLLINPEQSDEDRERNRRVEFRVLEGQ